MEPLTDDVLILGAGASGLMCAVEAGKRGRRVRVIDHAATAGTKIRLAGGGKCNFTNRDVTAEHFVCQTPHFVKSALSRYTQWDFIDLLQRHQVRYHERDLGRYFCDDSAEEIVRLLLAECAAVSVKLQLECSIQQVQRGPDGIFSVLTDQGRFRCESLVVALGGLSWPSANPSALGYDLARQFGLNIIPPGPGLVPLTLLPEDKGRLTALAGIALEAEVRFAGQSFRENLLFTHRGLSGPVVLQVSTYWQAGQSIQVNLLPDIDLNTELLAAKRATPRRHVRTLLTQYLPKRLVDAFVAAACGDRPVGEVGNRDLQQLAAGFHNWSVLPAGDEGYRTAEVTRGGVDCHELSSKTMEVRSVPGLYFTGEVLDVTGWLGGYNLQWAWSSGWCAGQVV